MREMCRGRWGKERKLFHTLRPKSLSKFEMFSGGIRKVRKCFHVGSISSNFDMFVIERFLELLANLHPHFCPPSLQHLPWYISSLQIKPNVTFTHHAPKYRSVYFFSDCFSFSCFFVGCEIVVVGGRLINYFKFIIFTAKWFSMNKFRPGNFVNIFFFYAALKVWDEDSWFPLIPWVGDESEKQSL